MLVAPIEELFKKPELWDHLKSTYRLIRRTSQFMALELVQKP